MKPNPLLAKIEAKHRAEMKKCCTFTIQFTKDIAMLAINQAFHAGPVGSQRFSDIFEQLLVEYCDMITQDSKDIEYSKYKMDEALKPIMGKNFVPYSIRYGG